MPKNPDYDFKSALNDAPMVQGSTAGLRAMSGSLACDYLDKHWPTIKAALQIAEQDRQKENRPHEQKIAQDFRQRQHQNQPGKDIDREK